MIEDKRRRQWCTDRGIGPMKMTAGLRRRGRAHAGLGIAGNPAVALLFHRRVRCPSVVDERGRLSHPGERTRRGEGASGAHGAIGLSAFGTTTDSTITVSLVRPRWHAAAELLPIHSLTVTSGLLGGLDASAAELTGAMTPLNNTVSTLELGGIGPGAQIVVNGSVSEMTVALVDLGPSGRVVISGALNTADLAGPMTIGGITIDGGRFVIGQDSLAPISVTGNMDISQDGLFSVGRDLDGGLTVNGNLELDTGGQLMVGRNLSDLTVNGNVIVNPTGSGIVVNGALNGLTVNGIFQGQGGTSAPTFFDLGVGLNFTGLTINGGNKAQNGLINANIRAGGSISGVDIAYGTVNSTIQPFTPPPLS